MAEMHIIGQIFSARDFPKTSLFCRWQLIHGASWKLIEGQSDGQTQTDSPDFGQLSYFCHPIDVHLVTRSMQGWPKIQLQIWHLDSYGRQELYGYGFGFVPTVPGQHTVDCVTWRPVGSVHNEVVHQFLGGGLQIRDPNLILGAEDRFRLSTVSMGTVQLRLGVIFRNFDKFGIECF